MSLMSRIAIAVVAVASATAGVDGSAPAALRGNSSARRLSAGLGGRFVLAHRYNVAANPADEFDVITIPDQNLTHSCSNYIDDGSTVFTRDGKLVLKVASACDGGGCLNSGRIMSKRAYKYGIFTFSAKVPKCNGVWPAFWLLPGNTNGTGAYGDWPCSGEIDVLETVDKQSVGAFNLVAGYGAGGPSGCGAPLSCNKCGNHGDYCTSTTMKNLKESFYEVEETKCDGPNPSWREHLFVLNWQPDKLAVYVDPELRYDAGGHLVDIVPKAQRGRRADEVDADAHPTFKEYAHADTPTWGAVGPFMESCHPEQATLGAPFDQPMKLVLNIAVGGYGGAPCSWGETSCTAQGRCGGSVGSEMVVSDVSVWEFQQ